MGMRRKLEEIDIDKMDFAKNTQFRRDIESPITNEDLVLALKNTSKSVSEKDLEAFDQWTKAFGAI